MAEKPDMPAERLQPPEDFHWGISYLREDIQDLRQEVRAVHNRIGVSWTHGNPGRGRGGRGQDLNAS